MDDSPSPAQLARREEKAWDPPIPLDSDTASVPPFPLQVFPQALQDLCGQSAASVGCPVDYPASHALAVAAGAIGASFDMQVKRGYWANSNLWVCVVAPPGSGKSPAVAPILAPIYKEHAERRKRGGDSAKKSHVYVSDVTVEKLAQMLCDTPRGLLMVWDEMAGWLTSFNQYKSKGAGNDRSHYLSIWDGRAVKVDRKGKDNDPVFVRQPRLSIVGGIQPDVLDSLRAGPSDGLFDRMLFAFPNDTGMPVETWAEVDEEPCLLWAKALGYLWERPMLKCSITDVERPAVIKLTEAAKDMWRGWTSDLADRAKEESCPPYFRSVGAKISGYAARLSMVVHLIHEGYHGPENVPQGIGKDDLFRGIELANYFLKHADRVYQASGRDDRLIRAKAILKWAIAFKSDRWTKSDAWAALRFNSLFNDAGSIDKPLEMLELHRAVRQGAVSEKTGPGRPPKGGWYEVNPALRTSLNAAGGGSQQ